MEKSGTLLAGMSPEAVREAAGNAGLSPPFLGKSLWADGRSGSHGLTVIRDLEGLSQMITGPRPSIPSLPIILQQYTPHGGCLFKVGSRTLITEPAMLILPWFAWTESDQRREMFQHSMPVSSG